MTQPYPLYPNIVLTPIPANETRYDTKVVHPTLEPVIYELAVRHPTWRFMERSMRSHERVLHVMQFDVYDDKTSNKLGLVEVSRNYGARQTTPWVFEIRSSRISQARERGDAYCTGDPKKAIKAVNKYFGPPSVAERIDEISSKASNMLYSHMHTVRNNRERTRVRLDPEISKYLADHWDDVVASMKEEARAIAETLPAINDEFESVVSMHAEISANKHLTVLITGDTYITYDGTNMTTYSSEDLPESIKINVGLLKLVDSGTVIPDVGVRVGDHNFALPRSVINS